MSRTVMLTLVVVLTLLALAGPAGAQEPGTTVAEGLHGPMGVTVGPDGSVWVIDSGIGGDTDLPFFSTQENKDIVAKMGDTARIVQVDADGVQTDIVSLPSIATGLDNLGGARLALLDDVLYATVGQWAGDASTASAAPHVPAVVKVENGRITDVANTWDFERANNPDGLIVDSHPYGITAGPDGNLWVADAGANDLLKINPTSGTVQVVATFDGMPGPFPNPARNNAMEVDPVPTAVAFDQAGNAYVSFLSGFPFIPGSAKVVRVGSDGSVSDYATGLTMLTDLATGPDGNMYAVQFGQFTETGPTPNSGAIIRVKEGAASEVVVSDLSFPTAIAFAPNGDAYVTMNGVGAPGSGEVIQYTNLVAQPGTPLPELQQPATQAGGAEAAEATQAQADTGVQPAQGNQAILPATGADLTTPVAPLLGVGLLLLVVGVALRRLVR